MVITNNDHNIGIFQTIPNRASTSSDHGKQLSNLGASKGGIARRDALSSKQRSKIASIAAKARWG